MRWTKTLCEKDSDGDGLSNGVELGDPCCIWVPGAIPLRLEPLSLPNDPRSTVPLQYDILDCRTDIILGPEPAANTEDSISAPVQSPSSIIHSPSPIAATVLPNQPLTNMSQQQSGEEEKTDENVVATTQTISTSHIIKTHASLGYAGFMLLLPLGFLSARYLQPLIGETWWLYASLVFQVAGFSCALSSWIVIAKHTSEITRSSLATFHDVLGFISIGLLFLLLVNSFLQLWKNNYGHILGILGPFLAVTLICIGVADSFSGIQLLQDMQNVFRNIQRSKDIFLIWIITQLLFLPLAELCYFLWNIAGGNTLQDTSDMNRGLYRRAESEYLSLLNNDTSGLHVLEEDSENEEDATVSRTMPTNSVSKEETNQRAEDVFSQRNNSNSNSEPPRDTAVLRIAQLESLWLWLRRLPWICGIVAALSTVVFSSIEIHLTSRLDQP